jgi:hypothetical protein
VRYLFLKQGKAAGRETLDLVQSSLSLPSHFNTYPPIRLQPVTALTPHQASICEEEECTGPYGVVRPGGMPNIAPFSSMRHPCSFSKIPLSWSVGVDIPLASPIIREARLSSCSNFTQIRAHTPLESSFFSEVAFLNAIASDLVAPLIL